MAGARTGADIIREARHRAGLTQAQLGVRSGVPQSVVSAYERGRRQPSIESLAHLVSAAGFQIDFVLIPGPVDASAFSGPVGQKVQRHRAEARELLERRGYLRPEVFGSVARGADRVDSDVDLLVDLPVDAGLYQLNRAAIDLEDLLGVPVDLIPRSGLRDRVGADIAADLVPL